MAPARLSPLVLFDFGCVLGKTDYHSFYAEGARYSRSFMTPAEFRDRYISLDIEKKAHCGLISTEGFLSQFRVGLDIGLSENSTKELALSFFKGEISEMVALKEALANNGSHVGILSNTRDLVYSHVQERNPRIFETYCERCPMVLSYQASQEYGLPLMKPDPLIYLITQHRLPPCSEVIFIDDKDSYLRAVLKIGLGWNLINYIEHVDSSEAIRLSEGNAKIYDGRIQVASSVDSIIDHLSGMGIRL